jgi:hypothetical protein
VRLAEQIPPTGPARDARLLASVVVLCAVLRPCFTGFVVDVEQFYEEHVRSLSPADQLRLAARIIEKAAASAEVSPIVPETFPAVPDPTDTVRWEEWLEATLRAGGERLRATMREMQARGILDAEGRLTPGELPEDMRPGSTTSLATD